LKRPRVDLDLALFQKLYEGLKGMEDCSFIFSGMGEPLLNPALGRMAKIAEKSHLMLVTSVPEKFPPDIDWKDFDLIRISVDSIESLSFGALRPGCSWERVKKFIAEASIRKEKDPEGEPEIGVTFLKHRLNSDFALDFLRYWKRICEPPFRSNFFKWPLEQKPEEVQWFQILGLSDFLGQIPFAADIRYTPLKRRVCLHAVTGFHLLGDGRVVICPYDIEGKWVLGNLLQQTPLEIWNSDKARKFRKWHLASILLPNESESGAQVESARKSAAPSNIETITEEEFETFFPCKNCQDWYHRE